VTHDGLWNEIKLEKQVKFLQAKCRKAGKRIKELEEIEKSHKKLNGELHQELELEKKNHAITKEDVQLKDLEIGRLMNKIKN
jgi:hypothetical protein